MTTKIFISGSLNIKNLDRLVKERIDKIISKKLEVLVGDAEGADCSVQDYLLSIGATKARVFCSGAQPRNNVGHWPVECVETSYAEGTRAFFTAKDLRMAEQADIGLMIWDAKSTGTLSNVIELLSRRKKSAVFVNKLKEFKVVGCVDELEELTRLMSEQARKKAEEKIRLADKIFSLKNEQIQMVL